MKSIDVVAVGNALIDILFKADDADLDKLKRTKGNMHLVDAAQQRELLNHFQKVEKTLELGGSALNAIRALRALGNKTVFAGMIGKDDFGDRISQRFDELGIVSKLKFSLTDPTGSCVVMVTPDGERTMNTNLGASRLYDESLVPHDDIKKAKIFHFTGYQWDTEGQKAAIKKALETAKAYKTLISFDVADPFVVGRFNNEFRSIIAEMANIVFANEQEAKLLYNCTAEESVNIITRTGAIAVIKLGAKGAIIGMDDKRIHVAPVATKVVDTTSAGDMFAAGFLHGTIHDKKLKTCGEIAALIASDAISHYGASVSIAALAKAQEISMKD